MPKKNSKFKFFPIGAQPFQTFMLVVDIATTRLNRPKGRFSEIILFYLFCNRLCDIAGESVTRDIFFMTGFINKNLKLVY